MATTQFMEPGTSATQGFEFWNSTGGTVTSDGTTVRNGNNRSIKLATGSPATNAFVTKAGIMADAGRRFSFWYYFDGAPAATDDLAKTQTSGATDCFKIAMTTARKLRLRNAAQTALADGTTVLATNTWYRISVAYTVTSTVVNEFRVYLNGVLEITATNVTISSASTDKLLIQHTAAAGANLNAYFTDIYVDNGTDLADTGNVAVTAKLPASTNANNWNTTTGTGAVNERPLSVTNGMKDSSISAQSQNYTLQAASVGDINISGVALLARCAWIWAKQETGIAGTTQMTDNGSNTTIIPTTSAALYTIITDSTTYPSNAAGIGMVSPGQAVDPVDLYECGTLIAYYAPPSAKIININQAINRAANY